MGFFNVRVYRKTLYDFYLNTILDRNQFYLWKKRITLVVQTLVKLILRAGEKYILQHDSRCTTNKNTWIKNASCCIEDWQSAILNLQYNSSIFWWVRICNLNKSANFIVGLGDRIDFLTDSHPIYYHAFGLNSST